MRLRGLKKESNRKNNKQGGIDMPIKLAKSGWLICAAAATALVGLIFYIITSVNGFLAGTAMNPLPIVFTAVGIILALLLVLAIKKQDSVLADLVMVAASAFLIAGFAFFVLSRVSLAADVYFIPVNYPQSEEFALNLSIIGLALYVTSIVMMIVASFSEKIKKA
jgi:hypothetical protein